MEDKWVTASSVGEITSSATEDDGLAFNKQLIAFDTREGARNTLKALTDAFIKWIQPGFSAEHSEFGEKVGRALYKVLWATGVGLGVWGGAAVAGVGLGDLAALAVKSPRVIEFMGGKEGWIAAFLTFVASCWPKKK